jgi:hypothetical protein
MRLIHKRITCQTVTVPPFSRALCHQRLSSCADARQGTSGTARQGCEHPPAPQSRGLQGRTSCRPCTRSAAMDNGTRGARLHRIGSGHRWGRGRRGGQAARYCSGDSMGTREAEVGKSGSRWRLEGWKTAEGNTTRCVQEVRIRWHKHCAKRLRVPVRVHERDHLQEPCPFRRWRRAPHRYERRIEGVRQHTLVWVRGSRRPM